MNKNEERSFRTKESSKSMKNFMIDFVCGGGAGAIAGAAVAVPEYLKVVK